MVPYETRKPKESIGANHVMFACRKERSITLQIQRQIFVRKNWHGHFHRGLLTSDLKICEWKLWDEQSENCILLDKTDVRQTA